MSNLAKRVAALETQLAPKEGPPFGIWAMTRGGVPLTDAQIEAAIQEAIAAGAPAISQFIAARWLA